MLYYIIPFELLFALFWPRNVKWQLTRKPGSEEGKGCMLKNIYIYIYTAVLKNHVLYVKPDWTRLNKSLMVT